MTLTVRLDHKVEEQLAEYAAANGLSKSEAVKRGLKLLFDVAPGKKSPYEIGKHLFGCFDGQSDLAENHSRYVKEAIRASHATRHRPPGRAV